jgi:hypothetical protein
VVYQNGILYKNSISAKNNHKYHVTVIIVIFYSFSKLKKIIMVKVIQVPMDMFLVYISH